jgi:hypothetical protein
MKDGLWSRFRHTLGVTLLFLILPIFCELLVYLIRPDAYPAYLPLFAKASNILLVFLCFGILLAIASPVVAFLLSLPKARAEIVVPCGFFALFSTLTMARLLPLDSGPSPLRITVFVSGFALAIAAFFLLRSRKIPVWRLLIATCLYCAASASILPYIFQVPGQSVVLDAVIQVSFFAILFLFPLKVIFAIAVFLGILFFPTETTLPRFARPNKIEPFRRVILMGIDGMSPDVLYHMAEEGKLPAFRKVTEQGVSGVLHTLDTPFSPLVWNTIYTGEAPEHHGIMAFTYTRVLGAPPFLSLWLDDWTDSDWIHESTRMLHRAGVVQIVGPALSKSRLRPALWNIADQNGMTSLVVGGWTSFPPEQIRGAYVSDFALMAGRTIKGTYYPDDQKIADLLAFKPDVSQWPAELQRYISKDERGHHVSIERLRSGDAASFVSTYYSSVDAFGHHFGAGIDMKSTSPADRDRYIKMRDQEYILMDRHLQDYLSLMDDHTLLIVCSDHGWHFDKRQHNYNVSGVLLLYGNGVRNHLDIEASIYNIAPTVAYALGLPPSTGFQDVPLRQAFDGIIPRKLPKEYEPQKRFFDLLSDKALEREKMEEMEDLQYINR